MITIKSPKEIEILREGGRRLALVLSEIEKIIKPGMATAEIDHLAEKLIKQNGGQPAFKNYRSKSDSRPFPASICVSINDEIVHGLPSKNKILQDGDIVGLDLGMEYKELYTDMAVTIPVGKISAQAQKFIDTAKNALDKGVSSAQEGWSIGDIGFAIQDFVEKQGFYIVKNLTGHGVGYKVHEEPEIPNFGKKKNGVKLRAGMVLAIEPIISEMGEEMILDKDQWTYKTKTGALSAQFEHTIVITPDGPEILTKI
jgi:methionyl aminopeptidase